MRALLAGLFLFASTTAFAQTTEIQSARSQAMGGAFRAMAFDNSAVDLNPAGLVQLQKFDFEGGYYRTAVDPATYAIQVSLADSITNAAGTGFAFEYRKTRIKPEGGGDPINVSTQRYVTAVGYPIVPQFLSIGMNGKLVQTKMTGTKTKTSTTSDFMLHSRPFQMLAICGGFDNLVNGGDAQAPRTIVGGVAVLPARWFAVSADVFQDLATDPDEDHLGFAAGAQWMPFPQLSLRGGLYEEAVAEEFVERIWTAGFGFNAETGSIDYAVRLTDGESETLSHHITLSVLVF